MAAARRSPPSGEAGLTLIELVVTAAILSIGVMAFILAFGSMGKAIQKAKTQTLSATPLTMEKLEVLKEKSYHRLLVSTVTATATEPGMGAFTYDTGSYPSHTVRIGDCDFIQRVLIEKMASAGNNFQAIAHDATDTGIKRITVYTIWQEDGEWKKYQASSLHSNPNLTILNSVIRGTVQDGVGTALADVDVVLLQNAAFSGLTSSDGTYSYTVPEGTYTLRVNKRGYYTTYSDSFNINSGAVATNDFTLTAIGTGTVRGTAWLNDHLVISQVVGSTVTGGFPEEYVEIFNPTTFTWLVNGEIGLKFQRHTSADPAKRTIDIDYRMNEIKPAGYYVFANTGTLHVLGTTLAADAVWDTTPFGDNDTDFQYFNAMGGNYNIIPVDSDGLEGEGAVELYRVSDGTILDQFGWNGGGCGHSPGFYEGSPLPECVGLQNGEQYYRFSSILGYSSTYGPAYDSGNNLQNWAAQNPIIYPPSNSSSTVVPIIGGTPAEGVVVSANDGLSSSTATFLSYWASRPYVQFELSSIATGTWQVTLTSGSLHSAIGSVVVTLGGTTSIPNATTTPAWPAAGYYVAVLSSTIDAGFISGTVQDGNLSPVSGITIEAYDDSAVTDADGKYVLSLTPGTDYTVEANPSDNPGYDTSYVSVSSGGWPVFAGRFTAGVDFSLPKGGSISGWITMNGADPLPNVPVNATRSGSAMGSAISDGDGYFTIIGVSTGSYYVEPQTDTGESVSPSSKSVTLSGAGLTVWSDTFTLSGAMGTIAGTVELGGVPIDTGVLIVATTGTISGSEPPANHSALRSGGVLYYATSSQSGGTYSVEVRGGAGTYNVYGWYSTRDDAAPTTTKQSGSGTVDAGGSLTVDLDW
ncbi:MAG: carboxypeptidase-like regulatory domain-containing protein [Elusimicrobiota bacterium]